MIPDRKDIPDRFRKLVIVDWQLFEEVIVGDNLYYFEDSIMAANAESLENVIRNSAALSTMYSAPSALSSAARSMLAVMPMALKRAGRAAFACASGAPASATALAAVSSSRRVMFLRLTIIAALEHRCAPAVNKRPPRFPAGAGLSSPMRSMSALRSARKQQAFRLRRGTAAARSAEVAVVDQ